MKVKIRDLLDSYIDEGEIKMAIRTEDVDMEKIRRDTMNKILAQENIKTSKKSKRRIAAALIAAAVVVFGSVSATAYIKGIRVNTKLNNEISTSDTDMESIRDSLKAEIVIPSVPDGQSELLGFRAKYLPEIDLTNADITETTLGEAASYCCFFADGEHQKDIAKLIKKAADQEDAYSYMNRDSRDGIYCIDIRSLAAVDQTFYSMSQCEVVKETSIDGKSAVYMTADLTQFGEDTPKRSTLYYILVFDDSNNAFINVSSTLGFEEVEKMVDGLEVIHTGILDHSDYDAEGGLLPGYGVG